MIPALVADPPLDPSADEGRRLLDDELAKAQYHDEPGLLQRFLDWLVGLVDGSGGGGAPLWARLVLLLLALLVVAVVVLAVSQIRRAGRRASVPDTEPLVATHLDADDYRERARDAQQRGELTAAAMDWFRALTRQAEQRALLDDAASRTAHEVAAALAHPFPSEADALRTAGRDFDRLRYGREQADEAQCAAMRELDERLSRARPALAADSQAVR